MNEGQVMSASPTFDTRAFQLRVRLGLTRTQSFQSSVPLRLATTAYSARRLLPTGPFQVTDG